MTVLGDLVALAVPSASNRRKPELQRIIELPELDHTWQPPDLTHLVQAPGGTMRLRPAQNKCLYYGLYYRGGLFFIRVGGGKTLICILLPVLLKARCAVLLIPSNMRADLGREWIKYSTHFTMPTAVTILTHDKLSDPDSTRFLEDLRPDLIVVDESDKLKNVDSRRTTRLVRYLKANPETMLFCMTGSMANDSLRDYAHIAGFALKDNSPLPLEHGTLETFCKAIDVVKGNRDEKALELMEPLRRRFGGDTVRDAYFKRLRTCPGVILSDDDRAIVVGQEGGKPVTAALHIIRRKPEVPGIVKEHLDYLLGTWITPEGEEIADALTLYRKAREISCGFYYRWNWPNGVVDEEWLEARQSWNRELRDYLPRTGPGYDSPALLARICNKWLAYYGEISVQSLADDEDNDGETVAVAPRKVERPSYDVPGSLLNAWRKWRAVKDRPEPPSVPVWLDYFIVADAIQWARKQTRPPVIWYIHDAIGQAIGQYGGFRFLGTGPAADAELASIRVAETIVASIYAHGRGKNMQLWSNGLVTCPIANGSGWEQLLGRKYRDGQTSRLVTYSVNVHTEALADAVKEARTDARFIEEAHGQKQLLNFATWESE